MKSRLQLLVLVCGVIAIAGATGAFVADATAGSPPSVTGQTMLVGAPNALACNGAVNVRVTLTGTAGVNGDATDVVLVLDLSGSVTGQKLTDLKSSAKSFVEALDLGRNRAGIITYQGTSATTRVALGGSEADLTGYIDGVTDANTSGASPHALGIQAAQTALGSSTNKKALALFTDGLTQQTDAASAATTAKAQNPPIRIATVGIGADAAASAMQSWATQTDYYQSGSSGFSANELVADIGAAVAVPAVFTLTETLGQTFTPSGAIASKGSVTGTGPLVWTGELLDETATLDFTATRNGSGLFAVTEEDVSTSALTVSGGTGTITPPATKKIEVLPCDAGALLAETTCTGGSCSAAATVPGSGVQFSLNAGSPAAGTEIFVAGLTSTPPADVCSGFNTNTNGVQIDIRPLTTPGNFEIRVPKAALGGKKWWQTDVCVGTNLKFITKIGSLANLRPGATENSGRWWGLLPSVPRFVILPGLGFVKGPYITFRGPGAAPGDAVVRFTVPYVANSSGLTTNGKAGYDPRGFCC